MSLPNSKRPSITLNDSREKKRAKHCNDDEGIAAQLDVAAASVARASTPLEAYDICFGMLMTKATCTQNNPPPQECTPVTLEFDGILLRVREKDSNRRIAVVVSNALFRLVKEFAVTLTANVCGKKPPIVYTSKEKVQTVSEMDGIKFCSLRIVVYGFLRQKDEISAVLAQDELFLQHPGKTEFDRNVKYLNPHYLLPPGQNMPEVDRLTTYACCPRWSLKSRELQTSMPDQEQSQILQIFNTTYQPNSGLKTIEASLRLATKLKSHQVEALVMMIEKEAGIYENAQFPAIWVPHKSPKGDIRYQNIVTETFKMSRPPPISGGILADEMGLGKTLSMLSLICHFLDVKEKCLDKVHDQPKTTLIVTPKSTIYSWEKQIRTHIYADKIRWLTYHGFKRHEIWTDIESQDIVLTTYETLRSDRAKESPLFEHDWARVVLDEAHKIRNSSSQIFGVISKLQTQSRWCLTGTPIQNSLDDFGSLLAFIKVPPFETKAHFDQYIIDPIKKNRIKGFSILRKVVAATCLRRTKATYGHMLNLPQKTERVEIIDMDRNDRRLYEFFKRFSYLTAGLDKASKRKPATNILVLISMLRLVCNHGEALLPETALKAWKERDSSVLSWEVLEANIKRCISCKSEIEESETAASLTEDLPCGHTICIPPPSAKVQALVRNISRAQKGLGSGVERPKSVIFSYWTKMLDLIGFALNSQGFQFQRIDGQSSMSRRKIALETFGNDPECNVMLASIGAAGEGIDLTSANAVHIVEPHWNPMAEAQAVDRVHRIGQQKDVHVVRYIVSDSIEQYVQWMQRDKQRLIAESLTISEEKLQDVNEVRWKILTAAYDMS
ncbi:SNF2 family domain-containing protein [Fusarium phyllophilum]|uniref:SNF2 family domain-containing protein n=1 Tax=Fusarium phyllophilum TaxID=47803 RepID=A0A8H5ITV1_9HYPO|nr:SNF2 family domain-containing protein [Fusarium phyllophilum]